MTPNFLLSSILCNQVSNNYCFITPFKQLFAIFCVLDVGTDDMHMFDCRSFSDWYYLQRVLRSSFPHLKIRDLPPRHELWVTDTGTRVQEIAAFLQRVLAIRQLLLCNIVHLFLQSHLSVDFIQENVDGKRQDDVSLIPRIPRIEFNLDNDHSVFENILKLKLDEQKTVESSQKTYHGPTTQSDSHKSVQNLFKKRKSSGQTNNMMAHLQALAEDSNFETNSRNKQRGSIVY